MLYQRASEPDLTWINWYVNLMFSYPRRSGIYGGVACNRQLRFFLLAIVMVGRNSTLRKANDSECK